MRPPVSGFHEQIHDMGVKTMPYGTVMWFSTKTGAGYIRTDRGKDVPFHNNAIRDSDPGSIRKGARVFLDFLKSHYGITAINVRATMSRDQDQGRW